MRFNLPMVTSEVRGTDRVALRPASLLGPLTGSPVSITEPPAFYVTWRDVGPDFTALVRPYRGRGNRTMWVYSFAGVPTRPRMQFWALQPGEYELRGGPDSNGDGKVDNEHGQQVAFEYRQRLDGVCFDLPPRTLYLLEVVQCKAWNALPAQMLDLAIMPRDIKLNGKPMPGRPCKGRIVVHNIGSIDAANISVGIYAPPVEHDTLGPAVQRVVIPSLACPADLRAKTATVEFSWTPPAVGKYRLSVSLATEPKMQEIHLGNNRASITVDVQ